MRIISMALGASVIALAAPAIAQDILFKPIVEARLRVETVEQDGPAPISEDNDATATTIRLRAGGEVSSGPFALLAESEGTLALDEHYNSGVNGKTSLPIIADPETVELNRLQIQYRTKPLVVTIGRQRINLDDQRFVGAVGWRQNEQSFDAARIEYMGIRNLKIDFTYAIAAQTIWGIDGGRFGATNRPTRIEGSNLFATVAYATKAGTLTGFAYLVDEDEPVVALQRNSSQTFGLRFAGARPFSKTVKLSYAASYARQTDATDNPVRYAADYAAAELGLDVSKIRLTAGYELLGSDAGATGIAGGYAFQTPFATLHKFNGWADKFLTTPATGLQDYYAGITYTLPKLGKTGPLAASVAVHRYDSDRDKIHYGDEYDAQLSLKLDKRLTALVKYADYRRKGIASFTGDADTRKFWAQLDYAF
ncbi:alginate export family protein [Sphingobium nicotianae]|uniref:Alginate export family protein n=1 Tax=Sphingobium nicotianae TaxID=2782607 RepID=A0A9X1AID8_9SPHN|nr:alginate export family protein [Sphingobium nicotianae]MBT2185921.1 alginate export family protein [Sphingobium nicotianae]